MKARQSTARTFMIGPILDADGVAVTGSVVGDIKVSKNGGIPAALDAGSTLTHRHTGNYSLAAAAGDFDTVGTAQFGSDDTVNACAPVNFQVIEEAVYDRDYAASAVGYIANQPVDVNTIKTQAVTCAAGVTIRVDVGAAAAPGASNGMLIGGSNAATTFSGLTTGALACTTITASGAVAFQSTFAVTTSTALAALSCSTLTASGAVAFQSTFAVTTSTSLAALSCTTLTASGAVAFQSTFVVSGATTLTGLTTGALSCTTITASGAVAFQSTFAVTTSTALAALSCTTLTASGAVALQSTVTVTGATSLAALSMTTLATSGTATLNALTVSAATTLTGAVSLGSTLGITGAITATNASNNLRLGTFTVDAGSYDDAILAAIATMQTSVDDLPTNAELATSQASADDATLAAIAALNNLSSAQVEALLTAYHVVMVKTTIATLASQTSFTLTAGSADNDAYNGCEIVIEDSATAAQKAVGVVDDYTGATKTVTLRTDPAVFTMAANDVVTIRPSRSLKSTVDNRTFDVTATGAGGVDWGNVENKTTTNDLTGTNIATSQVVASVSGAVGSVTGNVGGNVVGSVGSISGITFPTNFAAILINASGHISRVTLADTLTTYTGNTLQTANVATLITTVGTAGAGLTDLGGMSTTMKAQVEQEALDALQQAVPDSIPADGSRPSVQQAAYMMVQAMIEGAISGTTWTVRKPDGSTALFTVTLDSATTPTSKTRAT